MTYSMTFCGECDTYRSCGEAGHCLKAEKTRGAVPGAGAGEANSVEPLLQFFAYDHLPSHLQGISKNFNTLAVIIVGTLPRNQERTVALRKLLEAKDCAVRARLMK